ncbi:MAG: SMP-30/gluconolactonase/LRE family protein [Proteobacteria bacterium]|nr:SMP-30/gluconolactonase/LRE family protein [Pseudomonadota bacterium]
MKGFVYILLLVVCVLTMSGLSQAVSESTEKKETLVRMWETKPGLLVPESVLYHKESQILFVSNINGKPTEKNGEGFISRLSLDGKILDLKWAVGLNAPKGSVIYKNRFYVSDIDRLAEIDLETGQVLAMYPAPGSAFLNDVTADNMGNIYVSDMDEKASAIWRLSGGKFDVWFNGPEIRSPNGLYMEENKLMVGNSGDGKIKSIRISDKAIVDFATVGSGIDGLRPDGKGNYIVSDWQGKTSVVSPERKPVLLMDTSASQINSADLEYVVEKQLLLIPTFFHNTVVAYQFKS